MNLNPNLTKLKDTYPNHIADVSLTEIIWKDGSRLPIGRQAIDISTQIISDTPSLADQLLQAEYPAGRLTDETLSSHKTDPGRIRNMAFFSKIYGNNTEAVEQHLETILWMPNIFSNRFPLRVTTINDVSKKLIAISAELSELPEMYHRFLSDPPGAFFWREIAGTRRLSPHSFGIAIDINVKYSHYWQWDLQKAGKPASETSPLMPFQNLIPWEIILIFEKYGFIWGGKWHHYDTMHFEYRPELF